MQISQYPRSHTQVMKGFGYQQWINAPRPPMNKTFFFNITNRWNFAPPSPSACNASEYTNLPLIALQSTNIGVHTVGFILMTLLYRTDSARIPQQIFIMNLGAVEFLRNILYIRAGPRQCNVGRGGTLYLTRPFESSLVLILLTIDYFRFFAPS